MPNEMDGMERRRDVVPDELLTHLIAQLAHLLERRVDRAVADAGLTLRQLVALTLIAQRPGLSRRELACTLLTTPQAVSPLVSRLITAALIECTASRGSHPGGLTLTEAGHQALQQAAPHAAVAEAAALDPLDAAEVAASGRTLRRLLTRLIGHTHDTDGAVHAAM
ncbi:MarR family transcriptional regulator [Actinomycetospora endophytica]|uniref:MarR family transcriptional regulator n=1 Tax=Actinomycetospora endophytica TaxID=2291215 RepID=A0ABS8PGM4_9PSEU|nr:MarR family transcriptional regulator [Actinomycetospora endophytica]MCD2197329.1 MarR family transcriptional regulator [Actinomycetospora endophytica]